MLPVSTMMEGDDSVEDSSDEEDDNVNPAVAAAPLNDDEDMKGEETDDEDEYDCGIDFETYDANIAYPGDNTSDQVMRFWMKRRGKLVHPYLLVGYMLSPHPTIMAHNKARGGICSDTRSE